MSQVKREVPPAIKKILQLDIKLTKQFNRLASNVLPIRTCRKYYKGLEISCHGIPWFAFWICFTWLFNNQSLVQMQVNLLLGLVLDVIFVAVIKAYTRRKRPSVNTDDKLSYGPDVFSFPSGHASRAVLVAYFFMNLSPLPCVFSCLVVVWATAVCLSRVLLNRHHILDVVAGVTLGLFTGCLLGFLYVGEGTAHWIMNSLSDEKLDGGEFHV